MTDPTESVSELRARRILAKAMEVDSRELTTIRDLEVIARELGISASAFHAALQYERETDATRKDRHRGAWMHRTVMAAGIPIGFAMGGVVALAGLFYGALPMTGLLVAGLAGSGALIALERKHPTAHRFVFRNTVLWAGIAFGSLAAIAIVGSHSVVEIPWLYTLTSSLKSWFATAVLGAVSVTTMRTRADEDGSSGDMDSTRSKPGRIHRALRALRRIMDNSMLRNHHVLMSAARGAMDCR